MTEQAASEGGLNWALPTEGRFRYEYTHHRIVTTAVGLTKTEGVGDRLAEFIFAVESPGDSVRVTMTNIRDTGHSSDTRIEGPVNQKVYPVVVFNRSGRILESSSPETFPLTFSPELTGLTQGSPRKSDFKASFKSGFGRCVAQGTVTTAWESTEALNGSLCAVIVTTFDLQSVPGERFWSPEPPWFRGRTVAHFDLEVGRLALLASSSQLEQTIGWKRLHQNLQMSVRYLDG